MNAILDIVDTIFNDDDLHRLGIFLKDIETYPNTSLPAIDIASDGLKAFVMLPYQRIEGTAKERLLMMEINNAVKLRLFPQHRSGRRKIGRFKGTVTKIAEKFIFLIHICSYVQFSRLPNFKTQEGTNFSKSIF